MHKDDRLLKECTISGEIGDTDGRPLTEAEIRRQMPHVLLSRRREFRITAEILRFGRKDAIAFLQHNYRIKGDVHTRSALLVPFHE